MFVYSHVRSWSEVYHPTTGRKIAPVVVILDDFNFEIKFKFPGKVGMVRRKERCVFELSYVVLLISYRAYRLHECNVKFNIIQDWSYHDGWWDSHDGLWGAKISLQDPEWLLICKSACSFCKSVYIDKVCTAGMQQTQDRWKYIKFEIFFRHMYMTGYAGCWDYVYKAHVLDTV